MHHSSRFHPASLNQLSVVVAVGAEVMKCMSRGVPIAEAGANLGQCRYGNFPYGAHSATVNQPWLMSSEGAQSTFDAL